MSTANSKVGISFAFACLVLLGVLPVLSNSRPLLFSALAFALFLSLWQLAFALPLVIYELSRGSMGIFAAGLTSRMRRRTIAIIMMTGTLFGLSTYIYVFAAEKAGAANTAIAIQAYPLFSMFWEVLFLGRKKSLLELFFTLALLLAMCFLASGGSLQLGSLSPWFLLALCIPLIWSIAHVIVREVLTSTPITPAQVTFFRVLVSAIFLFATTLAREGTDTISAAAIHAGFQLHALTMGGVYYLELIMWFYAVRHIDVSLASSITVPWPALTMALAAAFLGEIVTLPQITTFLVVTVSVYGLIYANGRKSAALETAVVSPNQREK